MIIGPGLSNPIITRFLVNHSGLSKAVVDECLKYNVMTIRQLSAITKIKVTNIEAMIRKDLLTIVTPFADNELKGPRFVLWDYKFDSFIDSLLADYK